MGVNTEFTHDKIFVYTSTKKNQIFPHDVYMGKKFDHFSWFFYFFLKKNPGVYGIEVWSFFVVFSIFFVNSGCIFFYEDEVKGFLFNF